MTDRERVFKELEEIREKCKEEGWDCYGGAAVTQETYQTAFNFLNMLGDDLFVNLSLCGDAHGDINIEWYTGKHRLCSIDASGKNLSSLVWKRGEKLEIASKEWELE